MTNAAISAQPAPSAAQMMRHNALRTQAEKFVAQTFFGPMFKAMRASPFKSEMFSGGRGREVFQSMLDGVLAERMGPGAAKPLVDAIVARLDPATSRMLQKTRISGGSIPTLVSAPSMLNLKG